MSERRVFSCQWFHSFSRIGTKIWIEMPVTFTNLSNNAFKRKTKLTLFDVIASDDH